jgi:hypothetical protein
MALLATEADPLAGLRDIHLPAPPPIWPPAPGWWVAALLGLLALVAGLWIHRTRRRRAARRAALAALRELSEADVGPAAAEVSALLRRVALTRYDRARVAGLAGESWLRFLTQTGGGDDFTRDPGRALLEAPYRPNAGGDDRALIELAERWVRCNL